MEYIAFIQQITLAHFAETNFLQVCKDYGTIVAICCFRLFLMAFIHLKFLNLMIALNLCDQDAVVITNEIKKRHLRLRMFLSKFRFVTKHG